MEANQRRPHPCRDSPPGTAGARPGGPGGHADGGEAALTWRLIETVQRGRPTAVGVATGAVAVGSCALLQAIRMRMPLRVSREEERQGLDISAHGEEAYNTEFTG